MTSTVRILSIDGGGIRGLIPALVLAELERQSGQPACDLFDLVSGTSTGAIIAAALTRPKPKTAAEIASLYMASGPAIFARSPISYIRSAITGPKYDAAPLERVLREFFGTTKLSDAIVPLLLPCYDIERREAHFAKSWRALRNPADDFLTSDYLRAATAAPTYFSPALIHSIGGQRLAAIDGALYANNPAMCAMAEARVLFPEADRFICISLGVGEFRSPLPYEKAKNWGLLSWAPPVIDCCMDGSADTTHYQLSNTFGPNVAYHRFQIDLHDKAAGPAANPSDCIDDASPANIGKLINRARQMIARDADELGRLAVLLPSYSRLSMMGFTA